MADHLTKQNLRVVQLNFYYAAEDGTLAGVSAHVVFEVFEGETKLMSHAETIRIEVTDGERKALVGLLKRVTG